MTRSIAIALALLVACGDDDAPEEDASVDGIGSDASDGCAMSCDDGLFCNGVERCEDGACVAGTAPCTGLCDEDADACDECPDADSDGALDAACGGSDCDDSDPNRYPGNTEVCDVEGHDEDCDPNTLGDDGDGDGYASDECCNRQVGGELRCGLDCDDTRAGVNPGAVDGCGGGDEDCDGSIDDDPDSIYYRDEDNDTYGTDDDTVMACALPPGYSARSGDCVDDPLIDRANEINPGATEICNEIDDDCEGGVDDGLMCSCPVVGTTRACGFDPDLDGVGICILGSQTCETDGWGPCSGATPPAAESCNGADDDCDGSVDEMLLVEQYLDADGDDYGAGAAVYACTLMAGHAFAGGDCADMDPDRNPGVPEICNGVDDDCDGLDDPDDPDATTEGCPNVNGSGSCVEDSGAVSCSYMCNLGFYECNGMPDDGCETIHGPSHCGTCNNACGSNSYCPALDGMPSNGCACNDGWCDGSGTFRGNCNVAVGSLTLMTCATCYVSGGRSCAYNIGMGACICGRP